MSQANYYGDNQNCYPGTSNFTVGGGSPAGTYKSAVLKAGSCRQIGVGLTVRSITGAPTVDIYIDVVSPSDPNVTLQYAKITPTPITLAAGMFMRQLGQNNLVFPGVVGEPPFEFQVRLVFGGTGSANMDVHLNRFGST